MRKIKIIKKAPVAFLTEYTFSDGGMSSEKGIIEVGDTVIKFLKFRAAPGGTSLHAAMKIAYKLGARNLVDKTGYKWFSNGALRMDAL